jgi:HK97 family phage prohead protease
MVRIYLRSAAPVLIRASAAPVEIRAERRLCFYAAVFDVETTITEQGNTFREVIRPGAFSETLTRSAAVYACVEHRREESFATVADGLLLQQDARGLFASCYLPDSAIGNRVLDDVQAGRLTGCSFAFRTLRDRWHNRADIRSPFQICELLAVELVDVAVTARPAYPATVVSVRSDPKHRERRLRLARVRA